MHILSLNSGKSVKPDLVDICLTIYGGKYLMVESILERPWQPTCSSSGQKQIMFQNMCSLLACLWLSDMQS